MTSDLGKRASNHAQKNARKGAASKSSVFDAAALHNINKDHEMSLRKVRR